MHWTPASHVCVLVLESHFVNIFYLFRFSRCRCRNHRVCIRRGWYLLSLFGWDVHEWLSSYWSHKVDCFGSMCTDSLHVNAFVLLSILDLWPTFHRRHAVAFMVIFSGCISALIVKVLILQPASLHRTLISRVTEPTSSMTHNYIKQILKRIIKQPRPHQPYGQDYGMPSSHAASVCFFSTAIVLYQPHFIGVIACM